MPGSERCGAQQYSLDERHGDFSTTDTSIAGVEATGHNTDVGLELKVGLAGETRDDWQGGCLADW